MLNVVLVAPQIPSNTGNIGRTCVITGARLHLVEPIAFDLTEKALRRAGMGYLHSLDVCIWPSWDDLVAENNLVASAQGKASNDTLTTLSEKVHLFTKAGKTRYTDAIYKDGDWLVLGNEGHGLPREIIDAYPANCVRIPMLADSSALNDAEEWHGRYTEIHPELARDIAGNFVDDREGQVTSLNLSNAAAIALFEALRQTGYLGLA